MTEKEHSNVVSLNRVDDLPENPVKVDRTDGMKRYCDHPTLIIHEHDRSLQCGSCGAALDPFDYLLKSGLRLQRAWDSHRAVSHKCREIQKGIEDLKREEKRLKASIRRCRDKAGTRIDMRKKD